MRGIWNLLIVLALIVGAGVGGYLIGHRAPGGSAGDDSDSGDAIAATPTVEVATIQQGRVDRKITAYGVVTSQGGDFAVLSVPFESRVKKILVVAGQRVGSESPVIELEPSPDTQLQMLQAKAGLESAAKDLEGTRERFENRLATNQDLLQSQENLQIAQIKLDSMKNEGAGGPMTLKGAGLVAKVDVQEGQVVGAGTALVEIAGSGKLQARLGVEPEDAARIHAGDSVTLSNLNGDGSPIAGKVSLVSQRINPDTRLTDVFVSLPVDVAMPLDGNVEGEITIAHSDGLVVPRAAVLPADEGGFSLFTVEQGKAAEHKVSITLENDESAQVSGDGLAAGQSVVTVGNLELEDGMAVKIAGDNGAATEPASAGAGQEAAQ